MGHPDDFQHRVIIGIARVQCGGTLRGPSRAGTSSSEILREEWPAAGAVVASFSPQTRRAGGQVARLAAATRGQLHVQYACGWMIPDEGSGGVPIRSCSFTASEPNRLRGLRGLSTQFVDYFSQVMRARPV